MLTLPTGPHSVTPGKPGFCAGTAAVTLRPGEDTTITLTLEEEAEELEAIVVSSTRTGRRIEDEPTRVEVLAREEVEEKMLMTSGGEVRPFRASGDGPGRSDRNGPTSTG